MVLFWFNLYLFRFVSFSSERQAPCAFTSIGLMYCWYTVVFLECLSVVCASAPRTFSSDFVVLFIFSKCFLKVCTGSRVIYKSVGFGWTEKGVLKWGIWGCFMELIL